MPPTQSEPVIPLMVVLETFFVSESSLQQTASTKELSKDLHKETSSDIPETNLQSLEKNLATKVPEQATEPTQFENVLDVVNPRKALVIRSDLQIPELEIPDDVVMENVFVRCNNCFYWVHQLKYGA